MKLAFRPLAAEELAEARAWHELQGRGLGGEFMRSVEVAVAQIARFPDAGAMVSDEIRRAVLRKFPYSLLYSMEGGLVIILGCIHQHRDPIRWPRLDH